MEAFSGVCECGEISAVCTSWRYWVGRSLYVTFGPHQKHGRACRRLNPLVWRVAGSAPVAFVGEPGTVRFLADQLEAQIGEKARLTVDVWLRDEATTPGQKWAMKKEVMLIVYGMGDIERGRVCCQTHGLCESSMHCWHAPACRTRRKGKEAPG